MNIQLMILVGPQGSGKTHLIQNVFMVAGWIDGSAKSPAMVKAILMRGSRVVIERTSLPSKTEIRGMVPLGTLVQALEFRHWQSDLIMKVD